MSVNELQTRIKATKSFLQREIVRLKTNPSDCVMSYREVGKKMDMIHEAERVGIRNLGEHQSRKLTRMIKELENLDRISLN